MDNNSLNGPAQTMGDRIALLLKAKGLRQTDLAASIGVSDAALSAVVNGQTKNWKMAHLLAASRCLSTSIEYLVEGSPSDPRGYDDEGDDSPEAPLMLVEIHPKDIALLTAYRQLQPDARLAIRNLIQTLSAAQDPRLAQHEQQAHAAALARSGPKD